MAENPIRYPDPHSPSQDEAVRAARDNHQPAGAIQPKPATPGEFFSSVKDMLWSKSPSPPARQHESLREIVETVVFVVVLVLLLKSFIAEAFVIPTGSMADTLWGYQKVIVCPQCGYEFPLNCSQ